MAPKARPSFLPPPTLRPGLTGRIGCLLSHTLGSLCTVLAYWRFSMGKSYGATGAEATANTRLVDHTIVGASAAGGSGEKDWMRTSQLACEYRPHPDFDDDDPTVSVRLDEPREWRQVAYVRLARQ